MGILFFSNSLTRPTVLRSKHSVKKISTFEVLKKNIVEIIVKTFEGLENILEQEVRALGVTEIKHLRRAVQFEGDLELLYKANLHLRTALKVIIPIHNFQARNEREFYKKIYNFDWHKHLKLRQTFAIDPVVRSQTFRHSQYIALKMKDAIVDKFRDKYDRRPSIDREQPDVKINLYIHENQCHLSIDSSGESLHRRGFRRSDHRAPINEALAAAMILSTGWKGEVPFYDPMCGTGTIAIEAAMIAQNQAPNFYRREFSFMRWDNYDEMLWTRIKQAAKKEFKESPVTVFASDESQRAIRVAKDAMKLAGVDDTIELDTVAFEDKKPTTDSGILVFNPPYGRRMEVDDINALYREIGDHLKQNFQNFDAWIISGNKDALKSIGLRTSKKLTLYNGAIECKFHKYEMYRGTKKTRPPKENVETETVKEPKETIDKSPE